MGGVPDRTAIAEASRATPNFETVEETMIGAAGGEVLTIEDLHVTVEGHDLVKTSIPVTLMCGGVERGVGAGEGFA